MTWDGKCVTYCRGYFDGPAWDEVAARAGYPNEEPSESGCLWAGPSPLCPGKVSPGEQCICPAEKQRCIEVGQRSVRDMDTEGMVMFVPWMDC